MTAREKLRLEYPNKISSCAVGGCTGCPSDYGYLDKPEGCKYPSSWATNEQCYECWDREIVSDEAAEYWDEEKKEIVTKTAKWCGKPRIEDLSHDEIVNAVVEAAKESGVPIIKDSGNRREFETGAVRDIQEGKGRCDLLPLDVVAEYFARDGMPNEAIWSIYKFQEIGDIVYLSRALDSFNEDHWKNNRTMFLEVSIHFEEGAKKYGERNWEKGIPVHCYIDSAVRHYLKHLRGDTDEPHDRAFVWNIICAIWTCKHKPELNEYARHEISDAVKEMMD